MSEKQELAKPGGTLKSLINSEAVADQIARALPSVCTPDRFLRIATTTLTRVPKLAECTRESFIGALLECAQLGIEPDGRRAHLIPYGTTCQIIIDWKGLVELAKRSGDVLVWKAESVKEADEFEWHNGRVDHRIDYRTDRGALQCVYSFVKLASSESDVEVMTLAEVEAIRKRSKSGNSGPWVTDFEEMAKKTVIRRHSKRLTLSPEVQTAIEINDRDIEVRDVSERSNPFARTVEAKSIETKGDKHGN